MLLDYHTVGATIINWEYNDTPVLYVSELSPFEEGKAIRGGVPICFPWFGPKEGKSQHGFARTKEWDLVENFFDGDYQKLVFELVSDEETLEIWPYDFEAVFTVEVKENKLTMAFEVYNTNEEAIEITFALHTYFHVGDASKIKIAGLHDVSYIDKVDQLKVKEQKEEFITISSETDRIYQVSNSNVDYTQTPITIIDPVINRKIEIRHEGITDVIVWNPWIDKAKAIADMGDEDYQDFVCVEGGIASKSLIIDGDSSHKVVQEIIII
jgi:glucose-6-phosphate 1-epimerase